MNTPLAERIRPETIRDMVGQPHLFGAGAPLSTLLSKEHAAVPNMIFYGPSGVGKTTAANIIAKQTGMTLYKRNATSAGSSDIRDVLNQSDSLLSFGGALLYLDEIQYLNKRQQQTLLEYIEDGRVTLIASTTENPYFYIYKALLSRCLVFEFKEISPQDIEKALLRALTFLNKEFSLEKTMEEDALRLLGVNSGGDVRCALNSLEIAFKISGDQITLQDVSGVSPRTIFSHDRFGDDHYELVSALQKSIRGSDPDAAVFYLAKLLEAGDLLSACRRLLVIASEDIGLAYPMAITITKSCVDSALQLGLPEGRIPLAQAAVMLAASPKSNTAYMALEQALADVRAGKGRDMPSRLKNNHFFGVGETKDVYLYPHDYPNAYVKQTYLPQDIAEKQYYHYGENKHEQAAKIYWDKIKHKK
ncbi:MAG TPA: ATPase [Clostridiales bacterium]|nr:ATPase [Clostridiales bacterium]